MFFEKLPNYDGALDVEAVELGGSTLPGLTVSEGPSGLRIDGSLIGSPWSGGDDDATGQGEIHLHAGAFAARDTSPRNIAATPRPRRG